MTTFHPFFASESRVAGSVRSTARESGRRDREFERRIPGGGTFGSRPSEASEQSELPHKRTDSGVAGVGRFGSTAEPDLYGCREYRMFLKEWCDWKKQTSRNFSFRQFAMKAGFSSHAYLPKVLDGSRNLSDDSADQISEAIGLAPAKARFFKLLVRHDQSADEMVKAGLRVKLDSLRKVQSRRRLGADHSAYFSHWYYPVLRNLAPFLDPGDSPAGIGGMLVPPISEEEARRALADLEAMGLLERKDGRWCSSDSIIGVDRIPIPARAKARQDILQKGIESLDRFSPEVRHTHCALLALSEQGWKEVRALLSDAVQQSLEIAARDAHPTRISQVVVQLFPTTLGFQSQRGEPNSCARA